MAGRSLEWWDCEVESWARALDFIRDLPETEEKKMLNETEQLSIDREGSGDARPVR